MEVLKAIDSEQNIYFAFKVQISSHEMEQIKSCPVRFWDKAHKVWLIPYSKANWQLLFQKIGKISYNIVEEVIQLNYFPERFYKKKDASTISLRKKEKEDLSSPHQNAIIRMKEQLIIRRYQPNTHRTYLACMTEFLTYYNSRTVEGLTHDDIKAFMLHKIRIDKISESTQNSLINAIKFYYEHVEGRDKFYLYDLRPRKAKKLPGFLSKEETAKLLKATENIKHRLILQLIYSAGLRLGELIRLKVKDIHIEMGIIEIKCAKGKKDRITKLSKTLIPLLQRYLMEYKPSYYLIEGQTGGKYSARSVQAVLHQAVQKSGVDENTTVHTLRNTFATHLILDGMDIRLVQELLGHNSLKTTEIYTHITDKMKKDVISPLDHLDISE
jgi:integrase/recombinase XerD